MHDGPSVRQYQDVVHGEARRLGHAIDRQDQVVASPKNGSTSTLSARTGRGADTGSKSLATAYVRPVTADGASRDSHGEPGTIAEARPVRR